MTTPDETTELCQFARSVQNQLRLLAMDDELPEPPPPMQTASLTHARAPSPARRLSRNARPVHPARSHTATARARSSTVMKPSGVAAAARRAAPATEPPMDRDRSMRTLYDYHGRQIRPARLASELAKYMIKRSAGPAALRQTHRRLAEGQRICCRLRR